MCLKLFFGLLVYLFQDATEFALGAVVFFCNIHFLSVLFFLIHFRSLPPVWRCIDVYPHQACPSLAHYISATWNNLLELCEVIFEVRVLSLPVSQLLYISSRSPRINVVRNSSLLMNVFAVPIVQCSDDSCSDLWFLIPEPLLI